MGRHSAHSTPSHPAQVEASHGHSHGGYESPNWAELRATYRSPLHWFVDQTRARQVLSIALLLAALATAMSVAIHWPGGSKPEVSQEFTSFSGMTGDLTEGTVKELRSAACQDPNLGMALRTIPPAPTGATMCQQAVVSLQSGADQGKFALLEVHPEVPGNPSLQAGDGIYLNSSSDSSSPGLYGFIDFQRSVPLAWWLVAALLLVLLVGAWRGARSILGLAITLAIIVFFLAPALVSGGSPVPLAVTSCTAVLFFVLFLVHGLNWKTASAIGGTVLALALATIVSQVAVDSTGIRGLGDENNLHILRYLPQLNINGLLLAGMIVGALGVLNDLSIAQASTVNELYHLNPQAGWRHLFRSGMRVGQDHIASLVYTLVLSYTGVALPSIMLLSVSGRPLEQILTSDLMATELVRTITGTITLILAVPLTTGIAALTAAPRGARSAST